MIQKNLANILSSIPQDVCLVAVSKTKPNVDILKAYNAGQRIFGENKVQELVSKFETLPKDIQWHLIGHLQSNKVKYIAPFVSLIHAVDSVKLLAEINKRARQNNRIINFLFQVHIAAEETKFGFDFTELNHFLESDIKSKFPNVKLCGFMGMTTNTKDEQQVKSEFNKLHSFYIKQKEKHNLSILSMGMSGDYKLAIGEGSNMIRVGSKIFGERNYSM